MTAKIIKFLYDNSGNFHCDDGPAIVYDNGHEVYYNHGKFHRLDGPSLFYTAGDGTKEGSWFFNGIYVNEMLWKWADDLDIDLNNLTDADKLIIEMTWADYGK